MLAPVERNTLGEAGDRVLGRSVGDRHGARRVRRDRAVVDDAAALGRLRLHDLDRFLGAPEHRVQVDVDHRLPLLDGELLHRHRGKAHAGVVEEHIEPAPGVLHLGEDGAHVLRLGDVGRQHHGACLGARVGRRLLEQLGAASDERHVVGVFEQGERRRFADAGARARDERDSLLCHGGFSSVCLLC